MCACLGCESKRKLNKRLKQKLVEHKRLMKLYERKLMALGVDPKSLESKRESK
jgi:hypothetical protein